MPTAESHIPFFLNTIDHVVNCHGVIGDEMHAPTTCHTVVRIYYLHNSVIALPTERSLVLL